MAYAFANNQVKRIVKEIRTQSKCRILQFRGTTYEEGNSTVCSSGRKFVEF